MNPNGDDLKCALSQKQLSRCFLNEDFNLEERFVKLIEKIFLFVFYFPFLSTFAVNAQIGIVDQNAKTKPTLVVLGTYHMGTPGNNVVNPKVADITIPDAANTS